MIQFVVASHGNFALEAIKSAAMVCGKIPDNIHVISLKDEEGDIEQFKAEAGKLANEIINDPVLILSDFYGGSPFMNLLTVFRNNDYKLISGFNLPMIIELFTCSSVGLKDAVDTIMDAGRNSIRFVDRLIVGEEGSELD